MNTSPLVSVIIPAYNSERFLTAAVESVLAQTYPEVEVIIVDDGSTDNTAALADTLAEQDGCVRIKVLKQENSGQAAARNAALQVARGELIGFLDADDVYLPNKLRDQVSFLQNHPEYDLVHADYYICDENLEPITLHHKGQPPLPFPDLFVYRNWFPPVVPLLRSSLVKKVGGFDVAFRGAEDWDYWIRCAQVSNFGYLPSAVAKYRTHSGQHHMRPGRIHKTLQIINKHYSKDKRKHRLSLAAHYWTLALWRKYHGELLPTASALLQFLTCLRSYQEMKRVMYIVSLHPNSGKVEKGRKEGWNSA